MIARKIEADCASRRLSARFVSSASFAVVKFGMARRRCATSVVLGSSNASDGRSRGALTTSFRTVCWV